jgi:hypothetical protein
MSRQDVIEHLGTIAKSGTSGFLSQLTGDQKKDSQHHARRCSTQLFSQGAKGAFTRGQRCQFAPAAFFDGFY